MSENMKSYNYEYFEKNGPFVKKLQFPKFILIIGENNGLDLGLLTNHDAKHDYPFEIMLVSPIME